MWEIGKEAAYRFRRPAVLLRVCDDPLDPANDPGIRPSPALTHHLHRHQFRFLSNAERCASYNPRNMRAVSVQIAVNLVGVVESPGSPPAEFLVVDVDARVDNICGDARASCGVVVVGLKLAIGGMRDAWEAPRGSIALADNREGSYFLVLFDKVDLFTG